MYEYTIVCIFDTMDITMSQMAGLDKIILYASIDSNTIICLLDIYLFIFICIGH